MNRGHDTLESRISSLEARAEWCARAVVLGLALEVVLALGIYDSIFVIKWGTVGADALGNL